ncbi:MAG: YbgC/FadM family acyl-CoA thioesterase [Rhizomicrobium sp.]|jgi:acyl-CoA thioester hydrolase
MSEVEGFGRFIGKVHHLPIRVYYEDTDLSGIVYHANYLRFMERGRSEFFRCAGIARLASKDGEEPWAWTLRKAAIEYFRPARVDDLIDVRTTAVSLTGVRMVADQRIYCGEQLLTRGNVEACIITLSGKPRRIPLDMHQKLAPLLSETIP